MATLAGGTTSDVATLSLSNGIGSGATNQLPGGNSYAVKAHYAGDTNYGSSDSSAVTVTVSPESSKTKLGIVTFDISTGNVTNSNATSVPYAAPYILRADVTNASGSTCFNSTSLLVTYGCPTGSVSFLDNGSALGSPINLNSAANAEYLSIQLTGGTHTLTGNYTGDNSYTSSTGTDSITITPAPTVTMLQPNPPLQKVVIGSFSSMEVIMKTANLQTQGASPANSFSVFDGTKQVGTGPFGGDVGFNPSSFGSQIGIWEYDLGASFTISAPAGSHSITVKYNGDQNYQSSTSAPVTVDAVFSTTTALTSSAPSIQYGQNTTLTATVTPSQSAGSSPTGTVTFGYGGVTLGTMPLSNNQAVFTTNAIQGDPTAVFANYSGDSNYSDSSGQITETVAQISTTTAVSSSKLTIAPYTNVTFTVQITPASTGPAPPGSSVELFANGVLFGTPSVVNNQAQLTTQFSTVGTLMIQAVYMGDNNYATSSASLTETVALAPDFTVSATTPAPILPGQQATSVVTVAAVGGFTGSVMLACAVSPSNLTDTPNCAIRLKSSQPEFGDDDRNFDPLNLHDRGISGDALDTARAAPKCAGQVSRRQIDHCGIRNAFELGGIAPPFSESILAIRDPHQLAVGFSGRYRDRRMCGYGWMRRRRRWRRWRRITQHQSGNYSYNLYDYDHGNERFDGAHHKRHRVGAMIGSVFLRRCIRCPRSACSKTTNPY